MMPILLKPLTMIDPDGWQSTGKDMLPTINIDDPDTVSLAVGAAAGTAITGGLVYKIVSTEDAVSFVRVGAADNVLATAASYPVGAGEVSFVRLGVTVTHIHAGSGA